MLESSKCLFGGNWILIDCNEETKRIWGETLKNNTAFVLSTKLVNDLRDKECVTSHSRKSLS